MDIYKTIVVCRKLPLKIESTFAYDDYILVGTQEGHLLMYKLDIKSKTPSEYEVKTHLLRSAKQFSKKPIIQIQAIPEHRILVSLSDSVVSVHNLDKISFPHLSTLSKTKGATHFALDISRIRTLTGELQCTVRLVVVVKYQLLFYYWKNNDFHDFRPNIKLADSARSIIWQGKYLYVGLRSQYIQVAVEAHAGTQKELFPFKEAATEPLMLSLNSGGSSGGGTVGVLGTSASSNSSPSNCGLALCREKQTFIFDGEAKPLLDFPITWSDQPLSIADDSLFLLAALPDSSIEVLTTTAAASKILPVQRIRLAVGSSVSKPIRALGKWQGRPGQLLANSESDVVLIKAVAREQQIKLLQSEKYFELALKIVELVAADPDDSGSIKFEQMGDNASLLSAATTVTNATSTTTTAELLNLSSEASSSETEKLKLRILNLQALDKFCKGDFKEAIAIFASLKTDPSYVIGLYPDLLPEDFRARLAYPTRLPHFEGAILEKGLMALVDYLLEVRRKIKDDLKNIESAGATGTTAGGSAPARKASLSDQRSKHLPALSYADLLRLQSIIDTSLLKCYLHTNDALVAPLLRIPDNHCHLEETEKALKRRQKYNELVILYRTKGLHRNALDLLSRQARVNGSERDALANRRKLIAYMQELGAEHIDLIFDYSEWILCEHPDEGLEIFIDDSALELDESTALPRELVLEFLETKIGNPELVMGYLDHCIFAWKEARARFHDALINKYREKIRSLMAECQLEGSGSLAAMQRDNTIEILEEEVSPEGSPSHLHNSSSHHPLGRFSGLMHSSMTSSASAREYHLRPEPAGHEPGDLGLYRRKLMHLLEESEQYSTETLPTYLLHDGLFDERAIVMGKVGNHQEALVIYVHVLQDLQRAEEYCSRVYAKCLENSGGGGGGGQPPPLPPKPITPLTPSQPTYSGRDVYLLLFQQCLNTQPSVEVSGGGGDTSASLMRAPLQLPPSLSAYLSKQEAEAASAAGSLSSNVRIAIAILARHATRIDLLRALEMLPETLSVAALSTILRQSMEHTTSRRNYVAILRQLLHAQRLRAHHERIKMEQASRLVLTTLDTCQVCMKKIGKSVFVRYINRDLVHLGCREVYESKYL